MSKTRTEKLQGKYGEQVSCDFCNKKHVLDRNHMLTKSRSGDAAELACPECVSKKLQEGYTFCNI